MRINWRSLLGMNDKVQIFRVEPGFFKLFKLFKEKYRSLGRVGGSVSLRTFSKEEVASIAGFLGQSEDGLFQKGKIALLDFEKELEKTNFSEYSLVTLLEEVLQESISTKSEESQNEQKQEHDFLQLLHQELPDGAWWWDCIQSKSSDTRWIWSLYKQNAKELHEKLTVVFKAFLYLPEEGEFERLPFFAQRISGNPHFFDNSQIEGKLLLHCMHVDQVLRGLREGTMPKTTEELNELLGQYGLMRDDLWSFVTCQGILSSNEKGVHPVWKAAIEAGTVLNVPIKELIKVDKVWPVTGDKVWIVENSSVCSTLMDQVPCVPIICTHGQFRTASWLLVDLLVKSGCFLYYSGDIDPEGLIIAERLKKRYPEQVFFWRMDKASYEDSMSNEDISARLAKLDTITSRELEEVVGVMKERKKEKKQAIKKDLFQSLLVI